MSTDAACTMKNSDGYTALAKSRIFWDEKRKKELNALKEENKRLREELDTITNFNRIRHLS